MIAVQYEFLKTGGRKRYNQWLTGNRDFASCCKEARRESSHFMFDHIVGSYGVAQPYRRARRQRDQESYQQA